MKNLFDLYFQLLYLLYYILYFMAKKCSITGKIANNGYSVSHSHIRNKKIQNVNLQTKKIWDEKTNRFVKVRLSTKAIKTLLKKSSQL